MKETILSHLLDAALEERKGLSRLICLYCTVAVILFATAIFHNQATKQSPCLELVGCIGATLVVGLAFFAGMREFKAAEQREEKLIKKAQEFVDDDNLSKWIPVLRSVREISKSGRWAIAVTSVVTLASLLYGFLND